MPGESILIVEDEEGLVLSIEDRLAAEGFRVESATDGMQGEQMAASGRFDLVILDVMLPERDGFSVCQNLRTAGVAVPILMLTARTTVIDTVTGLRLGADDYLTKPFDMQELVARIAALLRRGGRGGGPDGSGTWSAAHADEAVGGGEDPELQRFGEFELDRAIRELRRNGGPIALTAQEYRLLCVFLDHPDRVLGRDTLLDEAWGYGSETTTRTVDVHVGWLRNKLGEDPANPRHLLTARGHGYRFVSNPE